MRQCRSDRLLEWQITSSELPVDDDVRLLECNRALTALETARDKDGADAAGPAMPCIMKLTAVEPP